MSIGKFGIDNGVDVLNGNVESKESINVKDSGFSAYFPKKRILSEEINNKSFELDEKSFLTEDSKQKLINLWYADHDFRTNKRSKDDERKKIEITEPAILLGIDFDSYFKKALLLLKTMKRPDDDMMREKVLDFHVQIIKDSMGEDFLSVFDEKGLRDLFLRKVEFFFNVQVKLDAYIVRDGSIYMNHNYFDHDCGQDKKLQELLDDRNKYFSILQSMIKTTEKAMFIKGSK
ncbi:MAG: hypothetical protein WCW04_03570 [Candidatus Paceibacterota bacterium]